MKKIRAAPTLSILRRSVIDQFDSGRPAERWQCWVCKEQKSGPVDYKLARKGKIQDICVECTTEIIMRRLGFLDWKAQ